MRLMKVCESKGGSITTPSDIAELLKSFQDCAQECFIVVTLNTKNKCIDTHVVTVGLADASLVHPREVFRVAIADGASGIIIAHNHPSGDPSPSGQDLQITRKLIEAGKIIDIPVMDHIVIGRPTHASLRELGLVNFE